MKKNKIILITGVAGMLGSELIEKVLKNNIVIGLDNFELGKKKFIKQYFKKKNFYFFNLDLSKKVNNNLLKKKLSKKKIDQVWLFAANSDIQKGVSDSDVDLKNTFLTTYNTLSFVEKFLKKNTKIIFASSSAIYGNIKNKINEKTLANSPESNYGSMKLASESYISSYSLKNKIQSFIFRFPNVVGINITHGILYDFNKKFLSKKKVVNVLGNGNQQKPYSFSTEILDCMLFAISKINKNKNNIFNIGPNDNGIKVKEIVKIFKNFFPNKKISYQKKDRGWQGDIPKYNYDTTKINKLGFIFQLNSKNSIIKAVHNLYK
jgi:UDP-glucose 4-epimerase